MLDNRTSSQEPEDIPPINTWGMRLGLHGKGSWQTGIGSPRRVAASIPQHNHLCSGSRPLKQNQQENTGYRRDLSCVPRNASPDIAFVGFELTAEQAKNNPGWFFVLQEQPTEPRFKLTMFSIGLDFVGELDDKEPGSTERLRKQFESEGYVLSPTAKVKVVQLSERLGRLAGDGNMQYKIHKNEDKLIVYESTYMIGGAGYWRDPASANSSSSDFAGIAYAKPFQSPDMRRQCYLLAR